MTPIERLRAWGGEPTGEAWSTASSDLAAGTLEGIAVIVKVARIEEERRGGRLMAWWGAHGGLPVLASDADAILMRRGSRSALDLPDAEAEDVLAATARRLHALPGPPASVGLVPLRSWFTALVDGPQHDPLLDRAASIARDLLAGDDPAVALHGDLHHGNVQRLDGRWVAIDPKGLVGHPAFDLANACCNPSEETAVARLGPRLERFASALAIDRELFASWVVAWCGLSLAWSDEGPHARTCRAVADALLR